jgi:hypothetical protein
MALSILIDEFDGDPGEFYGLVQEEVKKREIPGCRFKDSSEFRSRGWFSAGETAPSISVETEEYRVMVLAYRYGRSFSVSTQAYWQKPKMAEKERSGKLWFLEEVRSGAFSETINRSVRAALVRHMEKHSAPIPAGLNPKEVFYRREAQTGDADE